MHYRFFALTLIAACFIVACRPASAPSDESSAEAVAEKAATQTSNGESERFASPAARRIDAAALDAPMQTHAQQMVELADTIAEEGDGQALAVAALLRDTALPDEAASDAPSGVVPTMDEKARRWLDEAQRRAPDDVVVLVLAIHLERFDKARRQALIARWRALEPNNLVPILYEQRPEAELLDTAEKASVYDSHYDDFIRTMVQILLKPSNQSVMRRRAAQARVSIEEAAIIMTMGILAAAVMPTFHGIVESCRQPAMADLRRRQCRSIAGVLFRHSDTLISELIGASMTERLAETEAERREAENGKREYTWLSMQSSDAYARDPRTYMRRFAQLLVGTQPFTERSMMRQLVAEAGYSPQPPPGWQGK